MKNASSAAERAQTNANDARNLVDRSSSDSTVNLANATLAASHNLEKVVLANRENDEYSVNINRQMQEKLTRLKNLELKANDNITRIKGSFLSRIFGHICCLEAQNILEDHNDRINNVSTAGLLKTSFVCYFEASL